MAAGEQTSPSGGDILREGLWWNNPGLAQLLGLCPLLAVSTTFITGLGLGLATLLVLVATNVLVATTRGWLDSRVRLPAYVLIIATFVTTVDLLFEAVWFDLYRDVGLFVPLIVTNCVILGRAEAFASRHGPGPALMDGLAHGLGFLAVLAGLGALREVLGHGTLFRDADMLFGPAAANLVIRFTADGGLLLAILPPGAFFGLAALVAARNFRLARHPRPGTADPAAAAAAR